MIEYLGIADAPEAVKLRKRAVYSDGPDPVVLGTEDFAPKRGDRASRCWFFQAVGGKRMFIRADVSPFVTFPEDMDMGSVVGWLSKIDPLTGEVIYGGLEPRHRREVRARELQAWMVAGILVPAKVVW